MWCLLTEFPPMQYCLFVRRANCPCCSRIMCYRRMVHFISMTSFRIQWTTHCCCMSYYRLTLSMYYMYVLHCRFLKNELNTSRSSEYPGGIIGCEYKRAPLVVTLGQHYHVGAFFCGTVHLLMAITKLRSHVFGPGYWRLRRQSIHRPVDILQ